ncbi:hypothetical protein FGLOB1_8756 [Fusarium globosum]|uniref:Uncharacterized protein n=1 Tax=Fusarium globosum TaxID=78864 RepID=A0A8H5Y2H0_9HYPO|nr:hypothetical protein FGLOB1_8756 [Fusarium globosum]
MNTLDMSFLGSPDFDFSCLMDLDEAVEATQAPEQPDSMMLDALAFEDPGVMCDLTMTQILTGNAFQGSDHQGVNLYHSHDAPQHRGHIPQFQVGLDSMTSENFQFSTETFNRFLYHDQADQDAEAHSRENRQKGRLSLMRMEFASAAGEITSR